MNSADWWNEEFGAAALHVQDNPVLALNLAQTEAPTRATLDLAYAMNKQGGQSDYNDEQPTQFG